MRNNIERMEATERAIAAGKRGLGPPRYCKFCHLKHPARQTCEAAAERAQEQEK